VEQIDFTMFFIDIVSGKSLSVVNGEDGEGIASAIN
jgi:hypothetical protein